MALRSVFELDKVLDITLDGGRDKVEMSLCEAALDMDDIGLELVDGGYVEADDPIGLIVDPPPIDPPLYHPLRRLMLLHESGLWRAFRLLWLGLVKNKFSKVSSRLFI